MEAQNSVPQSKYLYYAQIRNELYMRWYISGGGHPVLSQCALL